MKFNAWSRKQILEGKKRFTSRKQRSSDDADVYCSFGPLPWWFIRRFLYRDEGAESPDELQRVINQIFRREVEGHEEFWVHVLNVDVIIKGLYDA